MKDIKHNPRKRHEVRNGYVLIGSDAHYWPGQRITTAHKAFLLLARELRPSAIIMNGDVTDMTIVSRHPRIGWEYQPKVQEELENAQERLAEIKKAAGKVPRFWTLGNHDARFELRLASVAAEYEGVHGIHLKDHFPDWIPAWSVEINGNTIVKHRWKGGLHAAYNNAKDSGRNIVTGHLHSLNVVAYTDYNGTRFGIDSGTIADPRGPQFTNWTEDNPLNWRSGFVALRYKHGVLQWPEILFVLDEDERKVNFNGETFRV